MVPRPQDLAQQRCLPDLQPTVLPCGSQKSNFQLEIRVIAAATFKTEAHRGVSARADQAS